ncbi:YqaA family protein [Alteromonas sp. 76-1]|uniref:YqaA family protein n=1 Tax=Alteromonas sp. 76-1 TaxID=2358187 RepID=UPI001E565028
MSSLITLGYVGMFVSAFLAATILPLSSELVFTTLALNGSSALVLLVVASAGNVLGSIVNYVLGFRFGQLAATKLLRVSHATFMRAEVMYKKWGKWSLLLAWVPIIGDPLTLLAGTLRTRFWFFLLIVGISKTARYAALLFFITH